MFTLNKTFSLKKSEIEKKWMLIDATDMIVGRLASRIALLLKGKHKPHYTPHMDCGDNIIVINADKIKFTGKKMKNKIYYRHSEYIGSLKETTPQRMMKCFPERILGLAVKRMLGRGPMARQRFSNLYIYKNDTHKHQGQKPKILDVSSWNTKNTINKNEQV
ncbi:50S ribosomal subunit protein L13 [Candidatus Xenohaliotis californiensis]|uniref:Large ribosomal subunit protein uL13 n=1 Tax=Candidatus Xenohaliotis californiensis TaxID=84677 RepID=A0ABP0EUQ1_9RICK|nr:50S ribosomal subunit protein L13 [Candidatus Xenohaliotis californiensis]